MYVFLQRKRDNRKSAKSLYISQPTSGCQAPGGVFSLIVRMRHCAMCLTPTSGPGYVKEPRNILSGCKEIHFFYQRCATKWLRNHISRPRLLSWEIKTTVIYRNKNDCHHKEWRRLLYPGMTTVISRNEDNCYLQEWRRLLSPIVTNEMKTTVISRKEDDSHLQGWRLLCQRMKTTVIYSNEYDCNHQGWRWLMSQNEDNPYLEKWRRLLSPGMKTTGISRNEDECYPQGWKRLLSREMKKTAISRNEDNWNSRDSRI